MEVGACASRVASVWLPAQPTPKVAVVRAAPSQLASAQSLQWKPQSLQSELQWLKSELEVRGKRPKRVRGVCAQVADSNQLVEGEEQSNKAGASKCVLVVGATGGVGEGPKS